MKTSPVTTRHKVFNLQKTKQLDSKTLHSPKSPKLLFWGAAWTLLRAFCTAKKTVVRNNQLHLRFLMSSSPRAGKKLSYIESEVKCLKCSPNWPDRSTHRSRGESILRWLDIFYRLCVILGSRSDVWLQELNIKEMIVHSKMILLWSFAHPYICLTKRYYGHF